ncbi:unnamed protein product [Brassica oleracea var. botrytis]
MIGFPFYLHFIFSLILFFKYLHIKERKFSIERLQGKKTETGLSSSPSSPSEFVAPNPKPTLSLYLYGGLVLPLQRTDETHIPNPSWMQSPSYEEAWNEPHIWFRPNKPPRQPDRSNEQTGTSNALALPCSKSTQKGVTENALVVGPTLHPKGFCVLRDRKCWKTWKKTLKVDKRQISLMEEEVAKAVGR